MAHDLQSINKDIDKESEELIAYGENCPEKEYFLFNFILYINKSPFNKLFYN